MNSIQSNRRYSSLTNTFSAIKTIDHAKKLIQFPTITPQDNGCQHWLAAQLQQVGFECHHFERAGVKNMVAKIGTGPKTVAFSGHTDVVHAGDDDQWSVQPFAGQIVSDHLIGRGIADMKGGIAAMLAATQNVLQQAPDVRNQFVWLITSDEEGEAEHGSKEIAKWLTAQGITLDMCIVGEPTSNCRSGDAIKIGRRGALSGKIVVKGKAGHVAYPHFADNAIHSAKELIHILQHQPWDPGTEDFPGTHVQITGINSGDFTDNVIPAHCVVRFNIRFNHQHSISSLQKQLEIALFASKLDFELIWERPCEPYFCSSGGKGKLVNAVEKAVFNNIGKFPVVNTTGGSSDGRFFAGRTTQMVELGLPNASIHQIDEKVHLSDLITLEDIYTDLLETLLY